MKKPLILSIGFFALAPILLGVMSYLPGSMGNGNANETIIRNCSQAMAREDDRFVAQFIPLSGKVKNWGFFNTYNYDFYDKRFSVAFRISKQSYTVATSAGKTSSFFLSSTQASTHKNNEDNNTSGLYVNYPMSQFGESSSLVNQSASEELNLNAHDKLFLKSSDTDSLELEASAFYPSISSKGATTGNIFLNQTYTEIQPNLLFVSDTVFEKMTQGQWDCYISFGQRGDLIDAACKELRPMFETNQATLSIPNALTVNNKTIQGTRFSDYPKSVQSAVLQMNKTWVRPALFVLLGLLLLAVLVILAKVSDLAGSYLSKYKKSRYYWLLGYYFYTILAGIGAIIVLPRVFRTQSINGISIYTSQSLSLQFVTGTLIAFILLVTLFTVASLFHQDFIAKYNSQSLSLSDVINTAKLSTEESPKRQRLRVLETPVANQSAVIFGTFTAPNNSAGACRCLYLRQLFQSAGYETYISSLIKDSEPFQRYIDDDGSLFLPFANPWRSLRQKINLLFNARKEVKKALACFSGNKPNIVIIYSTFPLGATLYLKRYCKNNSIKLLFDVVESQIITQQSLTSFFSYYLQQKAINRTIISKENGVIAISTFLQDYFRKKNVPCFLLPFVSNNAQIPSSATANIALRTNSNAIYILYAGNPFHKRDLLSPIFNAIRQMTEQERERFIVLIAGVDATQLAKDEGLSSTELLDTTRNIIVLGKQPHSMIETLYQCCDFTILIKPLQKRFSKAGFPTKVSESFAHGVPVITNLSSDLELYLTKENSIIIDGDNTEALAKGFRYALTLTKDQLKSMRADARRTSETMLDIENFKNDFEQFLQSLAI